MEYPIPVKRLAKSYQTRKDKPGLEEISIHYLKSPPGGPGHHPSPAGGLFSTAHDVARFCQMLAHGGTFEGKSYLSKETVRQMTGKQIKTTNADGSFCGFGLKVKDGYFGHAGAYKTDMEVDHGQIRVFLVQQSSDWAKGEPESEFNREAAKIYPPADAALAN